MDKKIICMKKILVTGGCGYIGSHTIVDLIESGYEVVSLDSNVRSSENVLEGIRKITGVTVSNIQVDLTDRAATLAAFQAHSDAIGVIHFAAFKSVEESTQNPLAYYENNLQSLVNVLRGIAEFNIPYFVFSSSCSVYGNVTELPVTEDTTLGEAESPYARSKQIGESIINDFSRSNAKVKSVILRYFNPAGAHISNHIGESSFGRPIYLVPVIMDTASGKREKMMVYGEDYDTRDGSCVRDFIHIMDLADAHTKALQFLEAGTEVSNVEVFNLGAGSGVTVLEMVKAFEVSTGEKLNYEIAPRRPGDVVAIYADCTKAEAYLSWKPKYSVEDIMRTAWNWEISNQ